MPSPVEERPGLLIRDSFRYSDSVLIIPPPLVECLHCFDGEQTHLDLRATVRITGDLQVGAIEDQLIEALTNSGFLEDENFQALKEQRHKEFVEAAVRTPSHAGSGYPDDPDDLRTQMVEWMDGGQNLPAATTAAESPRPT